MKLPKPLHGWDLTPSEAIAVQRELARRVRTRKTARPIRYVAGLDAAFSSDGRWCLGAVVLWDMESKRAIEQQTSRAQLTFPYIPGLLSFREAPALLAALAKLKRRPDLLMCDGHGVAHPRRFGIACHIGVLTGLPVIGCAKSILIGVHDAVSPRKGSAAPLLDRGERVGTVLRTRDGVKPVYVSIGHKIDLRAAEKVVMKCSIGFRLPEPTRLADHLSKISKKTAP